MIRSDVLGMASTMLAFGMLVLAGYHLAVRVVREDERCDPLLLGVAWPIATMAVAIGVATGLGALRFLRIEAAMAVVGVLLAVLHRRAHATGDPYGPLREALSAARASVARSPVLPLLTAHAALIELVHGILRAPSSWDSLMYHLHLSATWLRTGALDPMLGPDPTRFYAYQPGNGSLWFWWWMAPSHTEFLVNLASFVPWLALGLGAGAIARSLGVRERVDVPIHLTLLTPVLLRFVGTQYVDLQAAAALVGAMVFSIRWLERPTHGDAALVGAGLGLAAGTKLLALVYVAAWATVVALAALRSAGTPRTRLSGIGIAAVTTLALGGYFYLRNAGLGLDPFALACDGRMADASTEAAARVRALARHGNLIASFEDSVRHGLLIDALLGSAQRTYSEMGIGPQLILLVPSLFLPLVVRPERRRIAVLVHTQILAQLAFFVLVPEASGIYVFGNMRYLDGAIALGLAGAVAALEAAGASATAIGWLGLALAVQSLLQLQPELSRAARLVLVLVDALALVLVLRPALVDRLARRAGALALGSAVCACLLAPPFFRYRTHDRARSLHEDPAVHSTPVRFYASAFEYLDDHAGRGTVAVVAPVFEHFVYPAMGPRFERAAVYVNVGEVDERFAHRFPGCDPRARFSEAAWKRNLARHGVRHLLVMRSSGGGFPPEDAWAAADPAHFSLRHRSSFAHVYSLVEP